MVFTGICGIQPSLPDKNAEPNLVPLRRHETAKYPRLQQLGQGREDGQGYHGGHAFLEDFDVLVNIGILVGKAKALSEPKKTDDVQAGVLDLAGEVHGPEGGLVRDIISLYQADEGTDSLVDDIL